MLFRVARGSRNLISKRSVRKGQLKNVSYEIHVKSLRQDCSSMIVILVVLFIVHLHHSRSKTCQLTLYTGAPFIMENDYASWTFEIQTQACRRYNLQRRDWCEQDAQRFSKLRHAVIKGSREVRLQRNLQSPSECITNASNKRALIMQHWKKPDMIREVWVIFYTIFDCFSLLVSPKFLAETKLPAFGGKFWDFFC